GQSKASSQINNPVDAQLGPRPKTESYFGPHHLRIFVRFAVWIIRFQIARGPLTSSRDRTLLQNARCRLGNEGDNGPAKRRLAKAFRAVLSIEALLRERVFGVWRG